MVGVDVADDHAGRRATCQAFSGSPKVLGREGRVKGVKDQGLVSQVHDAGVAIGCAVWGCDGGIDARTELIEFKVLRHG